MQEISGQIVDVVQGKIFPGRIVFDKNCIREINLTHEAPNIYIMPGLIDSHIHIESSMLVPSEFARMVVTKGTVATVSDPHEIGNVLGVKGVHYMIENGKTVPFHFYFGAPSCVPATTFETSGSEINASDIEELLKLDEVLYLSEMMNFPGVIEKDREVMEKIRIAHKLNKPVDGHAPGLRGEGLDAYIAAGITTDHEAFTYEEGREKLIKGMKILIREGSAARNFDALIPLLEEFPDRIMFCTDDKPDGYEKGHINLFLSWCVQRGYNTMDAIRAATLNPVRHYGLKTGLLQKGDPATFIVVQDLKDFNVLETYINGDIVASKGRCLFKTQPVKAINYFDRRVIDESLLKVKADGTKIYAIEALDGELITKKALVEANIINGYVQSDLEKDVLKLVVVNRYEDKPPAVAFIKNMGLKKGAIAATVAHDSHNIIAVGVDDTSITKAINALIESKGGLVAIDGDSIELLALPVAGLMSGEPAEVVSSQFERLNQKAFDLGATLQSPFITLSFMALLVIPELKLSDKGLFDGNRFSFTNLFVTH